jgi:hypothetical protein
VIPLSHWNTTVSMKGHSGEFSVHTLPYERQAHVPATVRGQDRKPKCLDCKYQSQITGKVQTQVRTQLTLRSVDRIIGCLFTFRQREQVEVQGFFRLENEGCM